MKPVYRVMLISLLCLLLTLLSLGVGEISLSPAETWHYLYLALTSPEGNGMVGQDVVQFIRLPHLVLSFFNGAGLAVCGAVMQAVMKNPLADPGIVGVSSGAGLAGVMMLIFMPVFIGYITITFPAGLGIYWVVSNLVQIAQQWFMYRNTAAV